MRVAVLIPTWRRPASLERCLDGLRDQQRVPDEVIVAVREGDDETGRLLNVRQLHSENLRVVTVTEPGVVAALNGGLAVVRDGIVAITDDDTVPRRDWLARIESHFARDPRLGGLGGRDWLHPPSAEPAQATVGKLQWFGRIVGNHHLGVGAPRQVDVLKGANLALRHSAFPQAHVDERLRGAGMQLHWEIDVCLAIKRSGWRLVYDPAVSVDHYPAERFEDKTRSGPATGMTLEHHVHNETYLLLKWLPWWRRASALVYRAAVGTRAAPGLIALVERVLRERDRRAVVRRFVFAQRGLWQGSRTFAITVASHGR